MTYTWIVTEYKNLCEELKYATDELRMTGDIQAIMPLIIKFETSGFPDNDNLQKCALAAVADIVDEEFKKVCSSSVMCVWYISTTPPAYNIVRS